MTLINFKNVETNKNLSEIRLTDIDWNFKNSQKGILMNHFKYLNLIWLNDLLDFVLNGGLDKTFKRPNLYTGNEGLNRAFNFGKKQKEEIKKCLRHFYKDTEILRFSNSKAALALQAQDKWYHKKNLLKYQ